MNAPPGHKLLQSWEAVVGAMWIDGSLALCGSVGAAHYCADEYRCRQLFRIIVDVSSDEQLGYFFAANRRKCIKV